MTLNEAKEILKYNKDMLTFDPLYGEEVEPWYYGKDAEDLYNAIVCVEDCLKKAIPIEWIEQWLDRVTGTKDGDDISKYHDIVKGGILFINMLERDWEKENEC